MSKIIPTPELVAIVQSRAKLLVVKAFAGTGKTTALTIYSSLRKKARILYLAYNKPIQEAAQKRFPGNVVCKTTHGLAFAQYGRPYADAKKLGNVRAGDVMMAFKWDPSTAKAVLDVVNNFIYSADDEISSKHIGHGFGGNQDLILDRGRELWECMQSFPSEPTFNERIKMTHDGYLKMYALSNPDLSEDYDIILLDEAQDSNPVTSGLVLGQKCTRVLVGDTHQSIYRYRGSTDALEAAAAMEGAEVKYLTTSYRFGPDIATLATALLAGYRDEQLPLQGAGAVKRISPVVDRNKPHTVICRTNAKVFSIAAGLIGQKKTYSFIGGVENYPFDRLVDVQNLAEGKLSAVKDAFIKQLGSLAALQDYAKKTNDLEYGALLGIQKEYGPRIPSLVAQIKLEALAFEKNGRGKAMVELTTGHRSKGLEFEQVIMADDFEDFVTEAGHPKLLDSDELIEEMNLLYVAATRATHALEVNSSVARGLSALGQTDFMFPDDTAPSTWVDSLLDSPIVKRQEVLDFAGKDAGDPNAGSEERDIVDELLAEQIGNSSSVGAFAAREAFPRSLRP
ncbi:3'-5' exonuclease [Paucibacter soli]|uniref:3'-5' exonuclease n=1 Tax=Paucibacter soli TaxID=3133433 RepID=UPI0030A0A227